MTKIRLLHFADLHVGMENYGRLDSATGVNGRVLDFLHRFDELIDYGLEREVDLVIFAGDAFKTRRPNPTYQRAFARRVKRLVDAGVPIVLLVGNHDLPTMAQQANSIDIFSIRIMFRPVGKNIQFAVRSQFVLQQGVNGLPGMPGTIINKQGNRRYVHAGLYPSTINEV